MIDPTTGMKPGQRYAIESLERTHQFPGFFLDGKYYLGPELLTAVGWMEGERFVYDNLDAAGEPVFPDRIAGNIENLTLTLVDGTALKLRQMDVSAIAPDDDPGVIMGTQGGLDDSVQTRKSKMPLVLGAAVIGFLTGFIITGRQRRGR